MSFKHVAHSSFNTKIENKSKSAYLQQKEPNKPEQTGIKTGHVCSFEGMWLSETQQKSLASTNTGQWQFVLRTQSFAFS